MSEKPNIYPSAPFMQTATGGAINLADPLIEDINIVDIAYALAHTSRFGGHFGHYSVAQHSILVMQVMREMLKMKEPRVLLEGLLHDASEAYLGDMIRPLKLMLPGFKIIEQHFEALIFEKLLFDDGPLPHGWKMHPFVKKADLIVVKTEKNTILPKHPVAWDYLEGVDTMPYSITPVEPQIAFQNFLSEFVGLYDQMGRWPDDQYRHAIASLIARKPVLSEPRED